MRFKTRCSATAERPRCRVHYSFRQKWKTAWETIFYGPFRSIFNHCNIIGLKISNLVEKCKIRAITVFKVIEVSTNRKPLCNFLSVI